MYNTHVQLGRKVIVEVIPKKNVFYFFFKLWKINFEVI